MKLTITGVGEVKRVTIWGNLNSYKDEWGSISKKYKL